MPRKKEKFSPKLLTLNYILGLGLIGFLAIITNLVILQSIRTQATNGLMINITGHQRTMVHQLEGLIILNEDTQESTKKRAELNEVVNLLEQTQKAIIRGEIEKMYNLIGDQKINKFHEKTRLSKGLEKLYYGNLHFDTKINTFITHAKNIINSDVITLEELKKFLSEKEQLTEDIDMIVSQYQRENDLDIYKTILIITFILIFTLVTLILEGFIIFEPMVRKTKNEYSNLEKANIALENSRMVIEEINNKLEESNKTKDKFIRIATHELRTPITTINGYLSMILDGDTGGVNKETENLLKKIDYSSKTLLELVNEILDLKKMKAGKMNFNIEKINPYKLIKHTIENLKILADEKGHKLSFEMDNTDLEIKTDPNKFRQILINIINNAIKYTTKKGEINVKGWIENNHLKISVTDTGIGIEEKNLDTIFQEFGHIKKDSTKNVVSTGLGLSIVKTMIEGLGGNIEVESEYKKGSTFTVILPLS